LREFREELRLHLLKPEKLLDKKANDALHVDLHDLGQDAVAEQQETEEEEDDDEIDRISRAASESPERVGRTVDAVATPTRPRRLSAKGGAGADGDGDGDFSSADGLLGGTPGKAELQAEHRRDGPGSGAKPPRQRRLSLDGLDSDASGPQHPGSLACLAAENADIVNALGNGDKALAEQTAEGLLNPKGYTGECSKISLIGAQRATRAVKSLSDLAGRYHDISEMVFEGRADAGNAGRITLLIDQLTVRAEAFQAISKNEELKEVPSFGKGMVSLPTDQRVSTLNLAAAGERAAGAEVGRTLSGPPASSPAGGGGAAAVAGPPAGMAPR